MLLPVILVHGNERKHIRSATRRDKYICSCRASESCIRLLRSVRFPCMCSRCPCRACERGVVFRWYHSRQRQRCGAFSIHRSSCCGQKNRARRGQARAETSGKRRLCAYYCLALAAQTASLVSFPQAVI